MKTTRKRYTGEFKAKVALEAIRGDLTLAVIDASFLDHPWSWQPSDGTPSAKPAAGSLLAGGFPSGLAAITPHKQAGHMKATDQTYPDESPCQRGRPHMNQIIIPPIQLD